MSRLGSIRGRKSPALQAIEVEGLKVIEGRGPEALRRKERSDIFIDIFMPYLFVVRAVPQKQLLVGPQKWRRIEPALVPDQDDPAFRLQNANEFPARFLLLEPVKGLPGDNEINAVGGKRSCFCFSVDAVEICVVFEKPLGRGTHFSIWFNAINKVSMPQEQFRKYACPGPYVGDS